MACSIFNKMWLEKKLCDALITVDGAEFHAHKIILCGCSAYFRALFTDGFYPLDQHVYTIPGVSAHVMELIIKYAYVQHVTIREENVRELLIAADYLEMSDLVRECCEFLKAQLCPDTCVSIWRLAHFYSFEELKQQAFQMVLLNFEEIVRTSDEFLNLTVEQLSEIIKNDYLYVKQESMVFEAIIKWTGHSVHERKTHIGILVPKVRMGLLTCDYFMKNVKINALVTDDAASRPIINSVLKAMCGFNPTKCLSHDLTRLRLPNNIPLAIGGWNGKPINAIEAYDSRTDRWVHLTCDDRYPRTSHGTVFLNGFVYCIGGYNGRAACLNSVSRFDPISRTWAEVRPMHFCRGAVSVCVLDGQIYAIGGFGNNEHNSVERYDPQNDQWTLIAPMLQRRTCTQATVLNGNIYICGGFDRSEVLSTAEYYNPQTGHWTFIPNMSSRRNGAGVAAYGGELYVVGGLEGSVTLSSVEVYNPQSNSWRNIPDMITPRSNFGTVVMDNRLYVFGGLSRSETMNKVEYYDNKTDKWHAVKNMKISRCGLSCCLMPCVANMADFITPKGFLQHPQVFPVKKKQKILIYDQICK